MKRLFTLLSAAAIGLSMFAQDEFDAMRIAQQDIKGTARYTAMGGSFGALGGEVTAIKNNPGGLGVFRHSELALTFDFMYSKANGDWLGYQQSDDRMNFGVDNASMVISVGSNRSKGLLYSNFAFGYNRIKNYNRRTWISAPNAAASMTDAVTLHTNNNLYTTPDRLTANGNFDDVQVSWLSILGYNGYLMNYDEDEARYQSHLGDGETVSPKYFALEKGNMSEYNFAWGGNISNLLFVGAGINLRSLNYRVESTYGESFEKGGNFRLDNYYHVKGSGVNFNIGAIVMPVDFLRIGGAISTPTFWTLEDESDGSLGYTEIDADGELHSGKYSTPAATSSEYDLRTPMKVTASLAGIVGKYGAINVDYEFDRYQGMKFKASNDPTAFGVANEGIKDIALNTHTIKAGAEIRPIETLALRLGYAYQTSSVKDDALRFIRYNGLRTDTEYSIYRDTQYFSAGCGWRGDYWFIDLAWQLRHSSEDFYPYSYAAYDINGTTDMLADYVPSPARINTYQHNIVATFGLRF